MSTVEVVPPNKSDKEIFYKEKEDIIEILGENFNLSFNKSTGLLTNYTFEEQILLEKGPQVNFWRAPNDNDYGANMQIKYIEWKDTGKTQEVTTHVEQLSKNMISITFSKTIFEDDAYYTQTFSIDGNGTLKVTNDFNVIKGEHTNLFKFGNELILPESYKNITWYGKGPFESYADRQHAAKVGLYQESIADQYFPYIRPQETGNKVDVRWVILSQNNGTGLKIFGERLLNVSALNFSREDLDSGIKKTQKHAGELTPRKNVFVNIDGFQQGLGSINSWGALPLERYQLPYKSYNYSYWIVPIKKKFYLPK